MRGALGLILLGLAVAPRPLAAAERYRPEIVASYPHDPAAFTQGLVFHEGRLFESTGLYGASSLRRVEPRTGRVERSVNLADDRFGEGLALAGERLIQLTWRNGVAIEYDLELRATGSFTYEGEGWGLCAGERGFVMSDGTSTLLVRDPASFAVTRRIAVQRDGVPLANLNELECAGGAVYANVWLADEIVRIDAATGDVSATLDASGLLGAEEARNADVLNGIAYHPGTGHFFVTGKLWPKLFELRFPAEAAPEAAGSRDAGPGEGSPEGTTLESPPVPPRLRAPSGCGCDAPGPAESSWGLALPGFALFALYRRRERG